LLSLDLFFKKLAFVSTLQQVQEFLLVELKKGLLSSCLQLVGGKEDSGDERNRVGELHQLKGN
jgi:hypothetical protein